MRHDGFVGKKKEKKGGKKKSDLITRENIYLRVQGVKVKAGNLFKLRWMFTTVCCTVTPSLEVRPKSLRLSDSLPADFNAQTGTF